MDLSVAGVAALASLHPAPAVAEPARFLFLASLLTAVAGTTPLQEGDGSHMLEALLDDELARHSALSRRRSPLSSARSVALYRAAAATHLLLSGVLLLGLTR